MNCTLCELPAWLGLTHNKGQFTEIWELLGTMYFPFVGKTYEIGIFEIRVFRYNLVTSHLVMLQL